MKKKFLIVTIIILVLLLTTILVGCDPDMYYFDYEKLKEDIVKVELINYDNPEAKEYLDNKLKKFLPYDFKKEKFLKILPQEYIDDFTNELLKINFITTLKHNDSPQGNCIKVTCKNGEFIILDYEGNFACIYNLDGTYKEWIGGAISIDKFIITFEEMLKG